MSAEQDIGPEALFGEPVGAGFFQGGPLEVAPKLLGCVLTSTAGGVLVAGTVVETEAYLGSVDSGSHAATKGITKRNAVMYGLPGHVYVYFTYGNHFMLNLVCSPADVAGAVLVRALEPLAGIRTMAERRDGRPLGELCNGPGKLAQALGVDLSDNGTALGTARLQVYAGRRSQPGGIATSGRVGLTQGHELPYRFYLSDSAFVSRGRVGPAPKRGGSIK